jgi:sulfur carrier protein
VITIRINERTLELQPGTTISALVELLEGATAPKGVAVAINGEVVRRGNWEQPVRDGDEVELVKASQGG